MNRLMRAGATVALVGAPLALGVSAGDATPASHTKPKPCTASGLGAVFAEWSPYTSHQGNYLTVINRSTTACTVSGPLWVCLLGRHGQSPPTDAFTYPPGRYTIALKPGQWARALVTFVDYSLDGEPGPNCELGSAQDRSNPAAVFTRFSSRNADRRSAASASPPGHKWP